MKKYINDISYQGKVVNKEFRGKKVIGDVSFFSLKGVKLPTDLEKMY